MNESTVDISIVVCTRNRAAPLLDALASLTDLRADLQGDAFRYEILVVDNGSTDDTADQVARFAAETAVPVRYVHEARAGVVHARNCGVAHAAGEWIAFFDDDQLADSNWLAELLQATCERETQVVGGAVHLRLPPETTRQLAPFVRLLLGESVEMPTARRYDAKTTPGAGNLMIHRDVFRRVGLFSEAMQQGGEDTELFLRIHQRGLSAWYVPSAIIHHVIPAPRLEEGYLADCADRIGARLARFEQHQWGLLYPALYLARMAQLLALVLPQLLVASVFGDEEQRIGARCRWRFQTAYARCGAELCLFPHTNPVRQGPQPHRDSIPVAAPGCDSREPNKPIRPSPRSQVAQEIG